MTKILIVYTTSFGNTERMANAALKGAESVDGSDVRFLNAEDATLEDGKWFDALIVCSPIRHRSADSRIKGFIERVLEVLWLHDSHVGKVGGTITVGGGYGNTGAGVEMTQLGILSPMAANGMLIVPFPKTTPSSAVAGSHWGAHGRSGGLEMEPIGVTEEMCQAAYHHAANIARVSKLVSHEEWAAKGTFAPSEELRKLFSGEQ